MQKMIPRRALDQVAEQMLFNGVRNYTAPAEPGLEVEALVNLLQRHLSLAASGHNAGHDLERFRGQMVHLAALAFEGIALADAGKSDPHPIGPLAEQRSHH